MCRRYSARSPARYQDRVTTEEPAADITDTNLKEGGQLGFLVQDSGTTDGRPSHGPDRSDFHWGNHD
ncbi:MAG: hypothetical protein ACWGMY_07850 [Hyphomicrobiaceae bacterium]